ATPDTGSVSTTKASTSAPPCTASVPLNPVLAAHVLCAALVTTVKPASSSAVASVADATLVLAPVPIISLGAVRAQSKTTCAGSVGATNIAFLNVGTTTIIGHSTDP